VRHRAGTHSARSAKGGQAVIKKSRPSTSTAETMRSFGTLGSVGLAFVISIVIGAGGGLLIDRWIGAGHWGFFIGFFLGLAAGVVTVIRASKSIK
jgi:ATP synthase protein I